jgi:hypothetical protein
MKLGYAKERTLNLINETLKTINQFKSSNLHENFQLHVPNTIPPTFSFHTHLSDHQTGIIISYELHFKAHLDRMFTNIRLQLPLIITDHPQSN